MNSSDNSNNSNDNSNNIGNDGGNDSGAAHAANISISISVIVPAYNVQQFIDDCLHHIVEQMGPQHELIVVDDGSTDSTAARVEQVRAAHPQLRIVLQRQANQGISEARNAGLALARGDYIAFVDSDDRLLPGALAALDATIAARRPDVIATALRMWHPDAPRKDRDVFMSYPSGRLLTSLDEILVPFFDDRHMYIWCKVFRRAIYQQLAAPVFPPQRLFEDVSTVPLLLLRCRSLVYLPQVLLAYRKHPVSITRVISAQWCRDFVTARRCAPRSAPSSCRACSASRARCSPAWPARPATPTPAARPAWPSTATGCSTCARAPAGASSSGAAWRTPAP
jgi:glycosyltransferase involved in cell wall biosynthesis